MRVFVTGATGFIGSAIVRELIENDHQVVGLARSDAAANSLVAAGAAVHRGTLEDLESLRSGAAAADGVIHTAYFHAFSHPSVPARMRVLLGGSPPGIPLRFMALSVGADRRAIETLGAALKGSDRPLVVAFGTMALTPGRLATELDAVDPSAPGGPRGASEHAMEALAAAGVRASVLRLPPVVHGDGDHGGFIPQLMKIARKKNVSGYLGDGRNRWPAVHRLDAARLFRLALEHGDAGARYHGVAEEGMPVLGIAAAIGANLNVPVTTTSLQQAARQFGWLAMFLAADNPVSSAITRDRLSWEPTHPLLIDDLEHGPYSPARPHDPLTRTTI